MMVTIRSSSSDVISPALFILDELAVVAKISDDLPLVEIYIGFLANKIRVSTTDTLYLCQGVHDLLPAVDIGVEETKDELEVRFLS